MFRRPLWLGAAIAFCLTTEVLAEDVYYDVPLRDLELKEQPGSGGADILSGSTHWRQRLARQPYALLDGDGDAYVTLNAGTANWARLEDWKRDGRIAIRSSRGKSSGGRLFLPNAEASAFLIFEFKLPDRQPLNDKDARIAFHQAKADHYRRLHERQIPGAAWFRNQMRSARAEVGPQQNQGSESERSFATGGRRVDSLENTFALFSGSRAVSENLQLDRAMQLRKSNAPDVAIDKLRGITVKEIDWQPLIKDLHPALDPLARLLPADQHAVFFPSFASLVAVSDEISRQGTPLARLIESRSEDELLKQRYERQLGLPLTVLARLLGPQVIDSVALTGSDPYFFAGTDIALLFETQHPAALKTLLLARIAAAAQGSPGVEPATGNVNGLAYQGFSSPDRRVSSFVAELEQAVVVTNSTAQLDRLARLKTGDSPALAKLPEYAFFRGRYPRGQQDESAFVFLSDATIRRWCGPRWRIADSRRVRAASELAELQAEQMDKLAAGKIQAGPLHLEQPRPGLGELELSAEGVRSSVMGSLEFLTPIVELNFEKATAAEADAYALWRNRYQSNWRWAFDPIAIRLTVEERRLAADLSVMPLIWGSDYRRTVETSLGAKIKPRAGDPHDALLHVITAINTKSEAMRRSSSLLQTVAKINPCDWLGESVALYIDDDPLWQELSKRSDSRSAERFLEENLARLPIALYCEVANAPKLTLFMAGLRTTLDQVAPEMTEWETLKYGDQPYVRISPTQRARGGLPLVDQLSLYYAFWSDGLIVTLNENVLKRALDRRAAREAAKAEGQELAAPSKPWLGESMGLQFDGRTVHQLSRVLSGDYQLSLQLRSWDNLPILNEWRRRYPDRDPIELHEQAWHTRLVCPGGGEYVWNEEWQTMESTVFGHPGRPKQPAGLAVPWQSIRDGNFGVTFEQQGLRAKAALSREEP